MCDPDGLPLERCVGEGATAVRIGGDGRKLFEVVFEARVSVKGNGMLNCIDDTVTGASKIAIIHDAA